MIIICPAELDRSARAAKRPLAAPRGRGLLTAILMLAACVALAQSTFKMEVVSGKDVTGEVLKRLGLPNQDYCWEQCLEDSRCTGTRWGAIAGTKPGQCQLLTGDLDFHPPKPIKTEDGTAILVTASRKTQAAAR